MRPAPARKTLESGLRGAGRVREHGSKNRPPSLPDPASHELWACRGCHCLAARKRARAITRLYEQKLRPHGLRATQYSILATLALKGATPVGELADVLGLERTSLTRSAAVVERNGWIASDESDDGRERPLRLTDEGLEKLLAAFPDWREAQEMVDRGWPEGTPEQP